MWAIESIILFDTNWFWLYENLAKVTHNGPPFSFCCELKRKKMVWIDWHLIYCHKPLENGRSNFCSKSTEWEQISVVFQHKRLLLIKEAKRKKEGKKCAFCLYENKSFKSKIKSKWKKKRIWKRKCIIHAHSNSRVLEIIWIFKAPPPLSSSPRSSLHSLHKQ